MKIEEIVRVEDSETYQGVPYVHCPACKVPVIGTPVTTNTRFGEVFVCIDCEETWFVEGR